MSCGCVKIIDGCFTLFLQSSINGWPLSHDGRASSVKRQVVPIPADVSAHRKSTCVHVAIKTSPLPYLGNTPRPS